jgi:peptidoglycan hydrolase-like protein with peptidoglycan-binding domain
MCGPVRGALRLTGRVFHHITHQTRINSRGTEVRNLQKFLNALGYTVAKFGAGSKGKETTYFGPATTVALKRFQKDFGISPIGVFGPLTRAMVNRILQNI